MASVRARLEAATYSSSDDDDDSNSLAPYSAFNSLPTEDSLEQIRRRTTDINGDPSHYERTNSDVEEKSARLGKLKSYCYKCMDISVTVVVILVIWMVMTLPTAVYVQTKLMVSSLNSSVSSDNDTCTLYNATTVCTEHIQHYARCLYDVDSPASKVDVYISGSPKYKELERMFGYLNIFSESFQIRKQCLSNIKPLICLYYINICTKTTGIVVKPSVKQCDHVEKVCNKELEKIRNVLPHVVDKYLSECVPTSPLDNKTCIERVLQNSSLDRRCSKGFYKTVNGTCLPECGVWSTYSRQTVLITDTLALFAAVVAVVSGVAVLILSCVYRHKIYQYPKIFIIYQTILALVLAVLFLIGVTGQRKLFCQSRDLVKSVYNPTHFCIMTGITFYYVVLQLLLWWLWHTIAVFWAVTWPFHARKFNTSRNTKYLHIAFALASLVLPVGPVLVISFVSSTPGRKGGGFTITRSPPFLCTGFDVHINFWAYIFPVTLILATGVAFLILILRIIIKKHLMSKVYEMRTNVTWVLEVKVLLVLCYYVLLGTAVITVFTYALIGLQNYSDEFRSLLECERVGLPLNTSVSTCTKETEKIRNSVIPYPTTLAIVMLGILPAVNLVYIVKCRELRSKLRCHRTRQTQYTQHQSNCSRYVPYAVHKHTISCHDSLRVQTETANTNTQFTSQMNNDLR